MITHIIFDNNGVLTTNDSETVYKKVGELLGKSEEGVASLFEPHVKDLDSGKITQSQFYSKVLHSCNSEIPIEEFRKTHLNAYLPKKEVHELARKLSKEYQIRLLTNFGDAFWSMFPKWNLDKIFAKDEVFLSTDLKMAKPDKEIFQHVCNSLKIKPENAIFIDDNKANIQTANDLGFHAILYKDLDSLISSLKELNIKF